MRRSVIAVVAAAVVVATAAAVLHRQREQEWAHGGDRLKVDVEVVLTNGETFDNTVVRLGVPPGEATRFNDAQQTLVVRARWSGQPRSGGSFQLIALDERLSPPRPLAADGGWNSAGATGSNWAGAYEELARHYAWLGGVAAARYTDAGGMTHFPTAAVDAWATEAGTVTAWFRQWGDGPVPFTDPGGEIVVALVHVAEDGDVRWARRVYG